MPDRIQPNRFSVLSLTGWVLFFSALCGCGSRSDAAVRQDFSFADHHITCTVSAPGSNKIPDRVLTAVPLAMKTAIQEVGMPSLPAHLSILLQRSPTPFERLQCLFQPEVFAIQEGDELRMQVPEDPLKLTFRIAHEASHWLVAKQFPARPPLWLDEGLANAVGATAAAAAARAHSQQLERPQPVHLADSAYSLQVLTSLTNYPKREKQVAAFYWQAEALTQAIRKKLGKEAFHEYLALLSTPSPPDWKEPLKIRWYFNNGDIDWLARQLEPAASPIAP